MLTAANISTAQLKATPVTPEKYVMALMSTSGFSVGSGEAERDRKDLHPTSHEARLRHLWVFTSVSLHMEMTRRSVTSLGGLSLWVQ